MATAESPDSLSDEPAGSDDVPLTKISWQGPQWPRTRSLIAGTLLAVTAVVVARIVPATAGFISDGLSSTELELATVFVLLGVPASIPVLALAYDTVVRSEENSTHTAIRNLSDEVSQLQPLWIGCGGFLGVAGGWVLTDIAPGVVFRLPLILGFGFVAIRSVLWTECAVDPAQNVVFRHAERGDRTAEQSLEWTVGMRRFDLHFFTLFLFVNRGKRWYKGPHLLPVPTARADAVERLLHRLIERTEPASFLSRDERVVFGTIGGLFLAVGPLFALLTWNPALLLLLWGPSTLVALFALLHARRG